jgi:hypothetical protein
MEEKTLTMKEELRIFLRLQVRVQGSEFRVQGSKKN